ncbi:glycosyltransferase [Sphingomonas nostoxanthinifaciens]|uniref:glycosyltransferase n=1 Tax=Sphingomonas nostoxanthinifaciens TaxID=2872652 RepID=UPI001CC215F6|nr:glycosyltransferase [Sphingomonas nostoxanthinifaciens]UAK23029.1 glycosyltransferase [Sphingomonas nostoxanthinifaciens]
MNPTLIVLPSVPLAHDGERLFMDIKAVEGLSLYADLWPGPVHCLMRVGDRSAIAFGRSYLPSELPFKVIPFEGDLPPTALLDEGAVVLAAGDSHLDIDLPARTATPLVFIIEYTLATRLRILQLDRGWSLGALKSALWTLKTERRRRRAFRASAGLQANGTPAFDAYRAMSPSPMLYFDSRLRLDQMPTPEQVDAKADAIRAGRPLRLAFSGRLERMKGADHLVPTLAALAKRGIAFTFDLYGEGSLKPAIAAAAAAAGIADAVRIHGGVPFDEELVPLLKDRTDLFLCLHRQADPSCTYLETIGCGVPIVGYDNAAFAGVLALGETGIATPMDRPEQAAAAIATLNADRPRLARMARDAAAIGRAHGFEATFAARITHLRDVAGL